MQCDECNGLIVINNGEYVCCECGLVSERVVVFNAKWLPYISRYFLPKKVLKEMWIMRKYYKRNERERSNYQRLKRICNTMKLPNIVFQHAWHMLSKLLKEYERITYYHLFYSLLYAVRELKYPMSIRELKQFLPQDIGHHLLRNLRTLMRKYPLPPPDPKSFIVRYVTALDLEDEIKMKVMREALHYCDLLHQYFKIAPVQTFAGALVYLACLKLRIDITYRDLRQIGVSVEGVRHRSRRARKLLREKFNIVVPEKWHRNRRKRDENR